MVCFAKVIPYKLAYITYRSQKVMFDVDHMCCPTHNKHQPLQTFNVLQGYSRLAHAAAVACYTAAGSWVRTNYKLCCNCPLMSSMCSTSHVNPGLQSPPPFTQPHFPFFTNHQKQVAIGDGSHTIVFFSHIINFTSFTCSTYFG